MSTQSERQTVRKEAARARERIKADLARVEREEKLCDSILEAELPEPSSMYAHRDETHATYRGTREYGLGVPLPILEGVEILTAWAGAARLMGAEAREAGCLSIAPAEWMARNYADGKLQWSLAECVYLDQFSGEGFDGCKLGARFTLGEERYRVEVEVTVPWAMRARRVPGETDYRGRVISLRTEFGSCGEDARVNWSTGGPDSKALHATVYWEGLEEARERIRERVEAQAAGTRL